MDCFFCILDHMRAKDEGKPPTLVRRAETLNQGTALCREHVVILVRQQLAQQGRRPLLTATKQ